MDIPKKVLPGDVIASTEVYTNGSGTYRKDDFIVSSYFGDVNLVGKMITVKP